MAASLLDVKVIQHGQNLLRRNVCKLCTRNYSLEKVQAEQQDVQNSDSNNSVMHKRISDTDMKKWTGEQPFWEYMPTPLWKKAYEKLQIKRPDIDVPTVQQRGVELPRKVKRDELTILKALSETAQWDDPTVEYGLHDDNYLLHSRYKDKIKRTKKEGREIARMMMSLYKEAFSDFKAVPDIPSFNPVSTGYNDVSLSVNALKERIEKRKVEHAIEMYDRLVERGEEIPIEVEEKLFELLCVFGGKDPQELEPTETKKKPKLDFHKVDMMFKKHQDQGTVTAFMYNVYICGLIKHNDGSSWGSVNSLYKQMETNNIPVYRITYNFQLLNSSLNMKKIFQKMRKIGYVPNRHTFFMLYQNKTCTEDLQMGVAEKQKCGFELGFEDMGAIYYCGYNQTLEHMEEFVDYMMKQKTCYLDYPGFNILILMMIHLKNNDNPESVRVAKKLFKLRKDLGVRYKTSNERQERTFMHLYYTLMVKHAPFEDFRKAYTELVPTQFFWLDTVSILKKMDKENGDFLLTLFDDTFNYLPKNYTYMAKQTMPGLELIFEAMLQDHHPENLQKAFAEKATFLYTDYFQKEMSGYGIHRLSGRETKKSFLKFSSKLVIMALEVMQRDSSNLNKIWECYMDYTDTVGLFAPPKLSWEEIMWHVIEAQDIGKIKQFLSKVNISSSWVKHDFLIKMQPSLEKILEPADRETLKVVLNRIPKEDVDKDASLR